MDEHYLPEKVEHEARAYWDDNRAFEVQEDPSREKFYCLSMFPYPSGALHMGHVRNYTIGDVISRYQRMRGRHVLQPMGWDAFGLPAENAAIDHKTQPARWTYANIAYMKEQLQRLGFAYDWSRELTTCQPDYYRWEQWLFTRLFEQGLAYRREAEVNWDPVDQTVLANEQIIEGRGWRSGALVERRRLPQWFLRITDFAEELLTELAHVDWPESVKNMQRNWIGRSEGVELDFEIEGGHSALRVFTTRPDTIYGATFMAVAPEHPLTMRIAAQREDVAEFIEECRHGGKTEAELEKAEKHGIALGLNAINPFNGDQIPIWAANFVLMDYGTGAVMAVPAHDKRDHEFATQYGLPIREAIAPAAGAAVDVQAAAWTDKDNIVTVNSGEYSGLGFHECFDKMADWLEQTGAGVRKINYRLHDWGISRQRYWGSPVPVVHCDDCGIVSVPDDQLPVVLPEDVNVGGSGASFARLAEFMETDCPQCGASARRDPDTFDTFVQSSWYFMRFCSPGADFSKPDARVDYWMPVDQYIGGIEHAILHLMYARFYQKLLYKAKLTKVREPFSRLLTQGMVVADVETFFREPEGKQDGKRHYYVPADLEIERNDQGKIVNAHTRVDGRPVNFEIKLEKMSKSKGNGVDPEDMITRYGADTVRLYIIETSPPDQMLEWSDAAVEGASRFLRKLWRIVHEHVAAGPAPALDVDRLDGPSRELRRRTHDTIAKVSDDIGRRYKFNTACAACRALINDVIAFDATTNDYRRSVVLEALEAITLMLAPVVPHICHTLWWALGHRDPVINSAWPIADETVMLRDTVKLIAQVNGKLRGHVSVEVEADRETIEREAQRHDNVARFIDGRPIKKIIVVPGKVVNIVV